MKLVVLTAAVLLVGCGSRTLTPDQAERMSVLDLCQAIVTYRPENAAVASAEANRRGINCKEHEAAVNARIGAGSVSTGGGTSYVPPRTCRTVMIGNSMQTQCY